MKLKTMNYVNAISKLGLTFAAIIVGCSLFISSINKATANDTKAFNFPDKLTNKDFATIQNNGRYQMDFSSVYVGDDVTWYCMVWDTTTGRSQFYYGNISKGFQKGYGKYQLPSKPL